MGASTDEDAVSTRDCDLVVSWLQDMEAEKNKDSRKAVAPWRIHKVLKHQAPQQDATNDE